MSSSWRSSPRWTPAALGRALFTIATIFVNEALVCGLAATPSALLLARLADAPLDPLGKALAFAFAAAPAYALFALCLMLVSSASTRVTGARSPDRADMRIADMSWPMLRWARYMAACYVVRLFAGVLVRGTPIWSWYMRMNGARIGRRVFVNSLHVSDHNLLDFGDDVVIGAEVHLSGHTVERGVVKTGGVTLGRGVTIGLGSVIDIDVEIGPGAQIGALSFVRKHARLQGGTVYAGIPVSPRTPGDHASAEPPPLRLPGTASR
ncbi:MAG: hypothetical protein AB7Q29_14570 [Vicinamibacterales bacterium]